MQTKNISIIIPTLNESGSILECLQAVQPYRHACEIIAVDGGSIDNTTAIIKPYVDKLIVAAQGRAKQMNVGAQAASGQLLVFLHADTMIPAGFTSEIEQALNSPHWGRFDISLNGTHPLLIMVALCMNLRSRLTGIATGDQAIFVNRRLFEQVGGYPDIALMEDIALSKQLRKISRPLCLKTKVISSGRRWDKCGLFSTILFMWRLRLQYFFGTDPNQLVKLYYRGQHGK
jgi:rSAM/selenodomain-associated transferase 2